MRPHQHPLRREIHPGKAHQSLHLFRRLLPVCAEHPAVGTAVIIDLNQPGQAEVVGAAGGAAAVPCPGPAALTQQHMPEEGRCGQLFSV